MFKQAALIFGLSLALGLTACAQSESGGSDPVAKTQTETSKPKSSGERQRPEGKRPEGKRPDGRRSGDGEGRRQGRTPPEAAYAACASVALESSCTVETSRGTRSGVCRTRDGDDRAVCAMGRQEGGRRPRPSGQ